MLKAKVVLYFSFFSDFLLGCLLYFLEAAKIGLSIFVMSTGLYLLEFSINL